MMQRKAIFFCIKNLKSSGMLGIRQTETTGHYLVNIHKDFCLFVFYSFVTGPIKIKNISKARDEI